jgi:alkylation response protein AidB-like acyl-CoA dehydrogenase
MHASGVEVRPLRMMTGKARFNEVFLSDVRVPASALVGGLGDGWRVATAMLMYERVAVQSGATVGGAHARADVLVAEARRRGVGADPVIRQALVDVYIRETLASIGSERARALAAAGREPGPGGSVGKLASALVAARFRDVSLMVRGAGAMAWDNGDGAVWAERALDTFGLGIGGGTNEIQRNILGERVLGLPKEPAVDRGVPFRELPA